IPVINATFIILHKITQNIYGVIVYPPKFPATSLHTGGDFVAPVGVCGFNNHQLGRISEQSHRT
ncbi:MAG: hypothetical protein ACO29P_07240, partial [Bacteroidia bacterium]